MITLFASAWTFARRPRTNGLPINKKITTPRIGVTTMSSNQAIEEDGRRLPGIVPSATILMINSTRYKIKGAQAIAFTDTTSRILVVGRVLRRFSEGHRLIALWSKRPTHGAGRASPAGGEYVTLAPTQLGQAPAKRRNHAAS